jgi:class 3 adenylate cyclase/tetratricopeptide (TPR) repeat protein
VRTIVTIVFADLVRSTELSEQLDAEALRMLLSHYFDRMKALIHHHGGLVEKFIGDAIVAVFGIPHAHEDDALRAVRAADAMRLTMLDLNRDFENHYGLHLHNRIGVNTGEVVTGGTSGMEALATGHAMNLAARLQQAAEPGTVLLSSDTYRLVRDLVTAAPAEPLQLKGLQTDVQAFRLLSSRPPRDPRPKLLDSPLVGRKGELGALNLALIQVSQEHRCRLMAILGEAGVGKSRLVREFIEGVEDRSTVLRGRCLPYGEGITFWAFSEVVRQAANIDEQDTADIGWLKLRSLLANHPDAEVIGERVAEVIGLRQAIAIPEETFWAARKVLEVVAQRQPLIAVFDDIHWAESTFLKLIDHLLEWTREAPILVICIARPELAEIHPQWPTEGYDWPPITLESLPDEQCRVLLRNLVGHAQSIQSTVGRIVDAAEGNPLFVEQLLLMLVDEGVLQRHNGNWATTSDIDHLDLPTSIQALLGARLDRLEPLERDALERGSIEGRVFHQSAVAELSDPDGKDGLTDALQTLLRRQLIGPERAELVGEQAYRFRHLLIHDTAYRRVPKKLRARLHERFADWLEHALGDRVAEYEEIVGYHLEQAHSYRAELRGSDYGINRVAQRASKHLAIAGRRALARGDAPAAANLLGRASRLLIEDKTRGELLLDLGAAFMDAGEYSESERTLNEAIRLSAVYGDQPLQAHARIQLGRLRMQTSPDGSAADAMLEVESATPILEADGDSLGLARAFLLQAEVHNMRGRALAMEDALNSALAHARNIGARREQGQCLWWLAMVSYFGPRPASAVARQLPEIVAASQGDRLVNACVLFVQAGLETMAGRVSEARAALTAGKAILLDLGLRVVAAATLSASGIPFEVEVAAGDPAAAEREERYGYEILHAMRERSSLPTSAAYLADALYLQGRYEEAESLTEISKATAAREDLLAQIQWRGVGAKVLARRGQLEPALRLAEEATGLAEETDYLFAKARALMDHAEVLQLAQERPAAIQAIARAIELYNQKEDRLGVVRAERQLEQLASVSGC